VISAITLSLFLFSVIGFYSTESLSAAGFLHRLALGCIACVGFRRRHVPGQMQT